LKTGHKKIKGLFEATVFFYFIEGFYGFTMAIATFYIFPLSIEISGVLPALFGVLSGILIAYIFEKILKRILKNIPEKILVKTMETSSYFWIVVSVLVLVIFHTARFPFSAYTANGLYLGILAGILLFVQFYNLSKKQQIKSGIWYLFGLVLGILLK